MTLSLLMVALIGTAGVVPLSAESDRNEIYARLPLRFEANQGQTEPQVKFFSRVRDYSVFLANDEIVFSLGRKAQAIVRMRWTGGNPHPEIEGMDALPGATHYLLGTNANGWRRHVPSYARVRYASLYTGIDAVFYGNERQLEYDFILDPSADPKQIRLEFEGVNPVSLSRDGDLVLKTEAGTFRQRKPVAYQELDGERVPVEVSYVLRGTRHVEFKVGRYDHSKPLVIDPVIVYSSYAGGSVTGAIGDQGMSIAVDAEGNAYVAGFTGSPDFPTVGGVQVTTGGGTDAFVMKIDASGTAVLFSTYFGGSGNDEGRSIALDGEGNIFVAGNTLSPDLPAVNAMQPAPGGQQDAFLLKLDGTGTSVLFSTYLGGIEDDQSFSLAVDSAGAAYVTGLAQSRNFPVANAFQPAHGGGLGDVFVSKFGTAGDLVYSTYIGGIGHEQAYGIAVDGEGYAYAVGLTTSSDFPLANSIQDFIGGGSDDAFVLKLNPQGTGLVYSTFWGGLGSDTAVRVAVDDAGNAHVTGTTTSFDFPVNQAIQTQLLGEFDIFVSKFTPDGQDAVYSTLLGGFASESGAGIAVDQEGNTYVTGFTTSFEFPAINAVQLVKRGDRDAVIFKLTPDGQRIIFSTYLGAIGISGGIGIAVDGHGGIYLTGFTTAAGFPTVNPFQAENAGGQDAFVAKIRDDDIRTQLEVQIPAQGGQSIQLAGDTRVANFGYGLLEAEAGLPLPAGLGLITLSSASLLVSQVAVPAGTEIKDGRFFVDVDSTVQPGISIVNPTDEEITIDFFLTQEDGTSTNFGSDVIPPGERFSRVLTGEPFNLPAPTSGALTFSISVPVPVVALRAFSNESNETILSQLSIADLGRPLSNAPRVIPHLADGAGWATDIILVNTSEDPMRGEVRFFSAGSEGQAGSPMMVNVAGTSATSIEYDIPPRGFNQFQTTGLTSEVTTGWMEVIPFPGFNTPHASAWFTFSSPEAVTDVTLVESLEPVSSLRLYVEASGDFASGEALSTQTAFAIANPSSEPAAVRLELINLDGTASGHEGTVLVPASGQIAMFLHQTPGFENLPLPFKGILRASTSSPSGITAAGFRAILNEQGGFLLANTGPIVESSATGSRLVFPYVVDGGGFATQFVLFGRADGQPFNGTIHWLDEDGDPVSLTVR